MARVNGSQVLLTRIEFRLLEALRAQDPGDVSLEQLLQDVWGTTEGVGAAELVRTHVRNLRQKLAQIGLPDAIHSHRGRGYALQA
jgi:DNA-binding response OmpR family regulator